MKEFVKEFEGKLILVKYDEASKKVFFNLADVAGAAGFAKVSSLRYHTKDKVREAHLIDGPYLKVRALNKVAKSCTRTPAMARIAKWAQAVAEGIIAIEDFNNRSTQLVVKTGNNGYIAAIDVVPTPKQVLHTLTETAGHVGMSVRELSDWLVEQGYAARYESNGSIYFNNWFKEMGYGAYPVINDEKGERASRVPKITEAGIEFVKNRIQSEREAGVLSFAKKEAFQFEKQSEQDVDALIVESFGPYHHSARYDHLLQPGKKEYRVYEDTLIKKVKEIIAQVKVKE